MENQQKKELNQANARLIAAASDGVEFAKWVLEQGDIGNLVGDRAGEMRKRAADFIAKATGEA